MPVLAVMRHGQSKWNLEKRFTGSTDVVLTERGIAEASRAGELLAQSGVRFNCAFTSELARARETLRIVLEKLGATAIPVVRTKSLNERHYGVLQGLSKDEAVEKYGKEQVNLWRHSYDVAAPDGETLVTTSARILACFDESISPEIESGRNVLLVGHGDSLRPLIARLDGLSCERVADVNLPTGVPHLYEIGQDGHVVSRQILRP